MRLGLEHLLSLAVLALFTTAASAEDAPIALACRAAGDEVRSTQAYEPTPSPDGTSSLELKTRQSVRRREIPYEVTIDGGGAAGRLREAADRGKKDGGWREIRRLKMTDDAITGSVKYDILSGDDFVIDRRTGAFTIGTFTGACERMPLERKF